MRIRFLTLVLFFAFTTLTLIGSFAAAQSVSAGPSPIVIDARAPSTPFPHFWEQMFGSGRANLVLRERYLSDLQEVKKVTEFRYDRFHAIFLDDNGVYTEDVSGNPEYNFSYVDEIYDGLLQNGVRPCVEISFMPYKLSSDPPLPGPSGQCSICFGDSSMKELCEPPISLAGLRSKVRIEPRG